MSWADLHLHSTASDGIDSPTRVVERAKQVGLAWIALTDHDSVSGVAEARAAGDRLGVKVITGCEFTAYEGKLEIHMLGLGMDETSPGLLKYLHEFQEKRRWRVEEICRRLGALGVGVKPERVWDICGPEGAPGRVHVARALMEAGHVKSMDEAFKRYLGSGMAGDVAKMEVPPREIIRIIHEAGGVAVIAHACLSRAAELIPAMVEAGLDGIEVWHSQHRRDESDMLFATAERYGLLKTGGSDCHGALPGREPLMGNVKVEATRAEAVVAKVSGKVASPKESRETTDTA